VKKARKGKKKKDDDDDDNVEKRLRRFRKHAPTSYLEIKERVHQWKRHERERRRKVVMIITARRDLDSLESMHPPHTWRSRSGLLLRD
jgi:hypothetical protein